MKHDWIPSGILFSGAAVLLATGPAWAAPTLVKAVQLNPTDSGIEVMLETDTGDRPQVFAMPRGDRWVADLTNTQLRIQGARSFQRNNPAPGIASVSVTQQDPNSVRVTVIGSNGALSGEIEERGANGLIFSLRSGSGNAATQSNSQQITTPPATTPSQIAQTPENQTPPVQLPRIQNGFPVLPPGANVAPPMLPRAIAPPVGDIAVSNIDTTPGAISLNSNELVPRLVLKDAPVRDVLTLLARVASLNVAFAEASAEEEDAEQTISLDIENEPVQQVFNYVLRITGLEASRIGRTIFIGDDLPTAAQNLVMRTLRLNQLKATMPEIELESTLESEVEIGGENSNITRTTTQERNIPVKGALQILEELGANDGGEEAEAATAEDRSNYNLLRGLQVTADGRTNSITLLGTPKLVEIATAHLTQLDLRRRQVSVNVKIVEVDLNNQENIGASFSFGIADTFFSVDNGQLTVNQGRIQPPSTQQVRTNQFGRPIVNNPLSGVDPFINPEGTQLIRDPRTGEFVPAERNRPGSIFSPGGLPTTPGITEVTPQQLPADASPALFLDAQGIPRPVNELTIGGGRIAPFVNPEGELVEARAVRLGTPTTPSAAQQFFDFQGNPRLASELAAPVLGDSRYEGFTGNIQPLLSNSGAPVQARASRLETPGTPSSPPLFFDTNGIPRTISELTVGGGPFQPLFEDQELIPAGLETGLASFIGRAAQVAFALPQVFQYPRQFLAQLRAQVVENNAKILTDPTLIVQEGSQAQVNLTEEYLESFSQTTTISDGIGITTTEVEKGEAGIILNVSVDQIDDNGFITMSVSPEVSAPSQAILGTEDEIVTQLINRRRLETGNLRLRDGQTLILTGIIQDSDRQTVTKVPLLGDLPIIGSLFRSRNSQTDRSEVIVLVTPNIIDDSDRANFGYGYRPSPATQQLLQRNGFRGLGQ